MSDPQRLLESKKLFYTVYLNNIGGHARSAVEDCAFRQGVSLVLDFHHSEEIVSELVQLEGFESKNFKVRPDCARDNQRLVCEFLGMKA